MVTRLPQPAPYSAAHAVSRTLLRNVHERFQICVAAQTFNKHMQVIGHEAVRKNLKLVEDRSVLELEPYVVNYGCIGEMRLPLKRPQRKEITTPPAIRIN